MDIAPLSQEELDGLLADIEYDLSPCDEYSIKGEVGADGVPVIRVEGRVLGLSASNLVDTIVKRYINMNADLVLDLGECTFMASVALGFVVALAEQLINNNHKLYVRNANVQIKKVIAMLGFSKMLEIIEE